MAQTTRRLRDNVLSASVALPNAGANTNTNGIDLGATTPWPTTEGLQVIIESTVATSANTKNINFRLEDSADNSTFANIATAPNPALTVLGVNVAYPVGSQVLAMPAAVRRYIRVKATGEANGGDASDGTVTLSILL